MQEWSNEHSQLWFKDIMIDAFKARCLILNHIAAFITK